MEDLFSIVRAGSPWLATAIALTATWLTHKRATKAQSDESEINRAKMIHEGYQGVLDELRVELERSNQERREDKIRANERQARFKEEIKDLKTELNQEREKVATLEYQVNALREELDKVEKRHGYYEEDEQP